MRFRPLLDSTLVTSVTNCSWTLHKSSKNDTMWHASHTLPGWSSGTARPARMASLARLSQCGFPAPVDLSLRTLTTSVSRVILNKQIVSPQHHFQPPPLHLVVCEGCLQVRCCSGRVGVQVIRQHQPCMSWLVNPKSSNRLHTL